MTKKMTKKMKRTSGLALLAFAFAFWVGLAGAGHAAVATELAKVNGHEITDKDMTEALGSYNEGQRQNILKDSSSRRQLLNGLINQELLTQEGEKEKLDQDQEYKDSFAAFRKNYLSNKVIQKNVAAKLSEKEAKKYYELHKEVYSTEQIAVQHILTPDEAQANELLKRANAGEDFQALAEKYSKDPSAKNNRGDLGPINHESPYVQEFKDAAFGGKKGEIVGPVKTIFGYHLIKIVDRKPGKPMNYDEVELRVKNDLRQDMIQSYVSGLKKQAKVQVDDKAVEKM